jgi:hypothetical protein
MSEHTKERWVAVFDRYDWLVIPEGTVLSSPVRGPIIADCGKGEAHAARIASDHNACLGILDPVSTIPKLVAFANAHHEFPGHFNQGVVGADTNLRKDVNDE